MLHGVLVALLLPWPLAAAGVCAVLACYAAAAASPWPLVLAGGAPLPAALAAAGRHVSFVLTATLSAWFVARIAAMLRQHERLLREAAAAASRDECVLRVGALAAGAAHELASPLTTMAAIAGEMAHEADPAVLRRDAATIATQVEACRRTVLNLTAAAAHAAAAPGARVPLDRFLEAAVQRCQALRPDATLACQWEGALPVPAIAVDAPLEQAILILLNNAADASAEDVGMLARWDAGWLEVSVTDRGPGMPEGAREKLGRVFFSTKPRGKGTGLGLVLAADAVRRLGGTLQFANRADGGMRADVRIPLSALGA
ncbi:MAG: HAMP domain-containing sensor histidine kinase [Burkholderiales bacterium]